MAAGLPIALIDYFPTSRYLPYSDLGAALSIKQREALVPTIDLLLDDWDTRHRLTAQSRCALDAELHFRDGGSAVRIADFIEELVAVSAFNVSTGEEGCVHI